MELFSVVKKGIVGGILLYSFVVSAQETMVPRDTPIASDAPPSFSYEQDPFLLYPTPYEKSDVQNTFVVGEGQEISCSGNTPLERFNNCQIYDKKIAEGRDIRLSKDASQKMMERLSIEVPVRCEVPFQTNEIVSAYPMGTKDFVLKQTNGTDDLPRYEVDGYTFSDLPLDVALQELVEEAEIKVFSDDGVLPYFSAEELRGELKDVIAELTDAGNVYVAYDAKSKELYLSRYAKFKLQVPGGRIGLYAFIDGLKGLDIKDIHTDWQTNTLYLRLDKEKEATVQRLIDSFKDNPEMLVMDIKVYLLYENPDQETIHWQSVLEQFGPHKINMEVEGLQGKLLITDHYKKGKSLLDIISENVDTSVVAEGVAVMPNNWFVRFDIGYCARFTEHERDMSLVFKSNVRSAKQIQTEMALDTINGELTAFDAFYEIDDTIYMIGIPGKFFNQIGDKMEYMIVMKPKLIRLVK